MNRARKDKLREQIDGLDVHEHAQVFSILKRYTEEYTKTQSGVLVSSESLPDTCIEEMERLVAFYVDQRSRMDADERARKSLRKE